jgi:DNA-binding GntR family transcriptional regulator
LGPEVRRQLAAALARINDDLSAAAVARRRDNDRISELMTDFHVCFMDQCAGNLIRGLYDVVRPHVRRYEWAYGMESNATYASSIREHRGIIDAVARGDGARARLLIDRHWANGAKRTKALIGR